MDLHSLVKRQLSRSGLNIDELNPEHIAFIEKVSRAYTEFDQARYTYERSIDISSNEMRDLRKHLEAERQYIQSVMSEAFCILKNNHQIKYINKECERLLSKLNEEVEQKNFYDILTISLYNNNEPINLKNSIKKLENGEFISFEKCFLINEQQKTPVNLRIYPLPRLKDGLYNGAVVVMRDISVDIKYEQALQHSVDEAKRESKAKSIFLANMSHEIRSPMHGILGNLQLLEKTCLDGQQSRFVKMCTCAAKSLLCIIDDILDISKLQSGKVEVENISFDFSTELHNVIELFKPMCSEKKVLLTTEFDPNMPKHIMSDPVKLKQIINNLLSNALKFTPNGGNIKIKTNYRIDHTGYFLRVSISDNGVGIPKDKLKKIFDQFSQADASTNRQFGGTGLGLPISRHLAELMGGWIKVNSEPDIGSTFIVQIQVKPADKSQTKTQHQDHSERIAFPDAHILLVEDNPINMEIAVSMLKLMRCSISKAENGKVALDLLQNNNYDLILMDCQMPVIDGFTATETVRAREKEYEITQKCPDYNKIVALTANAFESDKERCMRCGMDDFLSKPFDYDSLKNLLSKHLPEKAKGLPLPGSDTH